MAKEVDPEPKRKNRSVSVADAIAGALDPVLKKRGFASRDIITHWSSMAPAPFDTVTAPDKLSWPRGERSADGATLYLRCAPGHALAAAHEAPRIAAAVNGYFGFVLVNAVRLSAEPFVQPERKAAPVSTPSPGVLTRVGAQVSKVEDEDLREALRTLGLALSSRSEPKGD
jgi:hypothetical protein